MEFWDIYDKHGNVTNRTHQRGNSLQPGDFHMVVENWIRNDKGEYLIQKRNKPLMGYINPWSTTAGSAIKGESSLTAIQRETHEEMGIYFLESEFNFIQRQFFDDSFMDVYESYWNGKSEDIRFDPIEVTDVKWVSGAVIQEMHASKIFYSHPTPYLHNILKK